MPAKFKRDSHGGICGKQTFKFQDQSEAIVGSGVSEDNAGFCDGGNASKVEGVTDAVDGAEEGHATILCRYCTVGSV